MKYASLNNSHNNCHRNYTNRIFVKKGKFKSIDWSLHPTGRMAWIILHLWGFLCVREAGRRGNRITEIAQNDQPTESLSGQMVTLAGHWLAVILSHVSMYPPCSVNGYITSFSQSSCCCAFTFCFSLVLAWEVCFCLVLCFRPAELICCNKGRPLVAGVPVRPWRTFVAPGVFPQGLLGLNASPFLAFVVPACRVFWTSPNARRGVAKGVWFDWKDFAIPKLLPKYNVQKVKSYRATTTKSFAFFLVSWAEKYQMEWKWDITLNSSQ